MTNIDYDKMWKEIIEANYARTHLLPGEKTVKMFSEEADVTIDAARSILEAYVIEKKLSKRTMQQGKARLAVYSLVVKK